jgi:mannose-6-phosphate isomerase-like protein (cupin superfamily)
MNEIVNRPWGSYTTIYGNDTSAYKVKKITVFPNKRLSLQSHKFRSEHWVITKGKAKVQLNDTIFILEKDQYIYIPINAKHRIENIDNEIDLEFIETQCGSYLGEDDITRYEDDFGRIPKN